MIMELSKIYEIKLTKKDAKDLATSLLSVLAKQGILKGGLAILSPALATSLTKIILSKSIQSSYSRLVNKNSRTKFDWIF